MFRNSLLILAVIVGLGARVFSQGVPIIKHEPAPKTDPASGAGMYHTYCAVCHGLDGRGDGPAAPALKQTPTDLRQISKENGGKFPYFHVERVIEGETGPLVHGSRDMPMWGKVFLSVDRTDPIVALRIHNLTEYLASLQQNEPER